jgi:hypothetical protein
LRGLLRIKLSELWARVVDNECKGNENENEEEHVRRGVALHGEINIQVGTKNKECNNEWKNRARPDKNHNTKEDEE